MRWLAACLLAAAAASTAATAQTGSASEKPPYPHGKFSTDCSLCHTADRWRPAVIGSKFKHADYGFALDGAHRGTACRGCHPSLEFAETPTACADCHADVHLGELGRNCDRCHTPRSFIDRSAQLRAHLETRFPLTGVHVSLDCRDCHDLQQQGHMRFVGTPPECQACHLAQYDATTDPNHAAAGFPRDCSLCHSTVAWERSTVDHSKTGFPLTGAHRALDCAACHPGNRFAGTPADCYACHRQDYEGVSDPNHVQLQFPTDCTPCHSTTTFAGATFPQHDQTAFPLTGAHRSTACGSCHPGGRYAGTPTDCYACHRTNYEAVTDPNHVQLQFPTDCMLCHTTTSFAGATFAHDQTAFPLTGAHRTVACTGCHAGGRYSGTPTDCYACHRADYEGVSDPNHVQIQFPTDCRLCHNTTTFAGATFTQHDARFPIYSGAHRGRWSRCSDCHTNPANYTQFTCLTCHTKADTDPRHREVSNYVYDSQACYFCHPTGRGGD